MTDNLNHRVDSAFIKQLCKCLIHLTNAQLRYKTVDEKWNIMIKDQIYTVCFEHMPDHISIMVRNPDGKGKLYNGDTQLEEIATFMVTSGKTQYE